MDKMKGVQVPEFTSLVNFGTCTPFILSISPWNLDGMGVFSGTHLRLDAPRWCWWCWWGRGPPTGARWKGWCWGEPRASMREKPLLLLPLGTPPMGEVRKCWWDWTWGGRWRGGEVGCSVDGAAGGLVVGWSGCGGVLWTGGGGS